MNFTILNKNDSNEYEIYDGTLILSKDEPTFSRLQSTSLIIAYLVIFVLSLIGNSVIIIVIIRKKRMRTINNFFLANITISNLIYTFCAPFPFIIEINEQNGQWIFPDILCPILPFLNTLSVNVNTLTMTASSFERLVAIICPLKTKLSKKNCFIVIFFIWVLSAASSLPWALLMKIQMDQFIVIRLEASTTKICFPPPDYVHIIRAYFFILNLIQYVMPLVALTITYSMITYYINVTNAKSMNKDVNKSNNKLRKKTENKLFKMQILMLVCFNVCWLPFQFGNHIT